MDARCFIVLRSGNAGDGPANEKMPLAVRPEALLWKNNTDAQLLQCNPVRCSICGEQTTRVECRDLRRGKTQTKSARRYTPRPWVRPRASLLCAVSPPLSGGSPARAPRSEKNMFHKHHSCYISTNPPRLASPRRQKIKDVQPHVLFPHHLTQTQPSFKKALLVCTGSVPHSLTSSATTRWKAFLSIFIGDNTYCGFCQCSNLVLSFFSFP